jgi:hypothetical protein
MGTRVIHPTDRPSQIVVLLHPNLIWAVLDGGRALATRLAPTDGDVDAPATSRGPGGRATSHTLSTDHGISSTKRERPGLDQALAAARTGDTLVVPKLDRLARSVPDARDIGDTLAKRGVSLSLGGQVYDPADPMGKLFFNILATFAEFEVDLIRMRTRERNGRRRSSSES